MDYVLLFFSFLGLMIAAYALKAFQSGAPFLPTRKKHLSIFQELNIHPETVFVDLGSGDGRLVFQAAQKGAKARGVEIQPVLHYFAQIKHIFHPQKKQIQFLKEDLWNHNISDADIVFLFFIQSKMKKMKEKLQTELKPGSIVVSHIFTIPGWQYIKKHGSMYIYKV